MPEVAEDQAVAWVAGGVDGLVQRLVDELPAHPDDVLWPVRVALVETTRRMIDPRFGLGFAAGTAMQLNLDRTSEAIQRLARCEGWEIPRPLPEPHWRDLEPTQGYVTDAVDLAVAELAQVRARRELETAAVCVTGGLAALTARLGRAVPDDHEDEMVPLLRRALATAATGMGGAARDLLRGDVVWTLGMASGLAQALGLHFTESAILKVSIFYRSDRGLGEQLTATTVEAVERALDELHVRFGGG